MGPYAIDKGFLKTEPGESLPWQVAQQSVGRLTYTRFASGNLPTVDELGYVQQTAGGVMLCASRCLPVFIHWFTCLISLVACWGLMCRKRSCQEAAGGLRAQHQHWSFAEVHCSADGSLEEVASDLRISSTEVSQVF